MWSNVKRYFESQPERLQIARILIENGLSVKSGRIFVNDIEVPPIRIARAAGVDRRTVKETVNAILANRELRLIFQELRCAGHSLKEVARHIGLGVIEITPSDAKIPGILAGAATVLAKNDISIRQAVVDDPELSPEPKLTLITEKKIPGELISEVLKIRGVVKVSMY